MTALPADIRLVFEDRPGYLYAEVRGPRETREIATAYWALVTEQCRLRGSTKVLLFQNLGQNEDELDIPALVDFIHALGVEWLQLAFVVSRTELIASMEHGQILAAERGLNGRVFSSVGEAERWLRYGAS